MNDPEIRRAAARGSLRTGWLHARFSLAFGDFQPPDRQRFSALRVLNEDWIQPGTGFAMHPHRDLEILILPLSGAVAHADSLGFETTLHPGEALVMSAGAGIRHSQMNPSAQVVDHHLQLWLLPRTAGRPPQVQWRGFPAAGRDGRWQLIAADAGRDGSLPIDQDASVWRAALPAGAALGPPPAAGSGPRSVYLHVISGSVVLAGEAEGRLLSAGDALAWRVAQPFGLRARTASELLLMDLPPMTAA